MFFLTRMSHVQAKKNLNRKIKSLEFFFKRFLGAIRKKVENLIKAMYGNIFLVQKSYHKRRLVDLSREIWLAGFSAKLPKGSR